MQTGHWTALLRLRSLVRREGGQHEEQSGCGATRVTVVREVLYVASESANESVDERAEVVRVVVVVKAEGVS